MEQPVKDKLVGLVMLVLALLPTGLAYLAVRYPKPFERAMFSPFEGPDGGLRRPPFTFGRDSPGVRKAVARVGTVSLVIMSALMLYIAIRILLGDIRMVER